MKSLITILFVCCFSLPVFSQVSSLPDPHKKIQVVDVSCGKCNFALGGESCKLAIRIKGKSYFVEGAAIDDFGDAHAKAGLCNAVRKAQVQGEIIDNKFKATYFKLVEGKKNQGLKVVL